MPIGVQHSPSALVIGQAATAGGQGELQRYLDEQRRREEALALQLEAQRQRQLENIMAQQQEAENNRRLQADRDMWMEDQRRQRETLMNERADLEYDRKREDALSDYDTERKNFISNYERKRQDELSDLESKRQYEEGQLTAKNQARVEQIKQTILDAERSGNYDEAFLTELRKRGTLEIMKIEQDPWSFKTPKSEFEPTVKEFNGVTFVQTSPGQWTQIKDPKAEKDPYPEEKQASIRESIERRAERIFDNSKIEDKTTGEIKHTKTEAEARAEAMRQLYPNGLPWEKDRGFEAGRGSFQPGVPLEQMAAESEPGVLQPTPATPPMQQMPQIPAELQNQGQVLLQRAKEAQAQGDAATFSQLRQEYMALKAKLGVK